MKRVLYIDNCNEFSSKITSILGHEGFDVQFLSCYNEGIDAIKKPNCSPNIVLCADNLNGIEGIGFLRQIKGSRKSKLKVPVIVLTDYVDNKTDLRTLLAGAVDIISRATEINYIIAKLHSQSRFSSHNDNIDLSTTDRFNELLLLNEIQIDLKKLVNYMEKKNLSSASFQELIEKFSEYLRKKQNLS